MQTFLWREDQEEPFKGKLEGNRMFGGVYLISYLYVFYIDKMFVASFLTNVRVLVAQLGQTR